MEWRHDPGLARLNKVKGLRHLVDTRVPVEHCVLRNIRGVWHWQLIKPFKSRAVTWRRNNLSTSPPGGFPLSLYLEAFWVSSLWPPKKWVVFKFGLWILFYRWWGVVGDQSFKRFNLAICEIVWIHSSRSGNTANAAQFDAGKVFSDKSWSNLRTVTTWAIVILSKPFGRSQGE